MDPAHNLISDTMLVYINFHRNFEPMIILKVFENLEKHYIYCPPPPTSTFLQGPSLTWQAMFYITIIPTLPFSYTHPAGIISKSIWDRYW